jgi:hypothetical protein
LIIIISIFDDGLGISYLPGSDPSFIGIEDIEQYQFVGNDLSKASNNPYVKWIIVKS